MHANEQAALFKRWLEQYTALIARVARAYTNAREDGEDLVQEILLQLWRSLPRFQGRASACTWIYRVALNTALAWRRSDIRRRRRQTPWIEIEDVAAVEEDGGARAENQEMIARLYAAIRALPKTDFPPGKNGKVRDGLWIALLCLVTIFASVLAYHFGKPKPVPFDARVCPAAGDTAVTNLLVPIRQKHHVPAIAAAFVTSKGLVSVGVVGVRRQGTEIAATLNDKWHLGSDTKAMTATLIGRLVERGRLKWDTTLAEVFPDLAPRFHADVRTITVLQLLSHHSGLPANPDLVKYGGADGPKERLRVLENELGKAPARKPGSHFEYSNLGYTIAGAIAEKVTGKSWEQAMRDEVFGPLGMTSTGFGGTGTPGQVDQPWGHRADSRPVDGNGPAVDNPPVLSPAGRVHCTIQDWAKFITDQLRGDRGAGALLKPETYRKLHTPPFGDEYALGWIVVERDWAGGIALNHGGDNTMNCANVWVAPRRDFAILVCINQSGETAFKASDEVVGALIDLHSKRPAASEPVSH